MGCVPTVKRPRAQLRDSRSKTDFRPQSPPPFVGPSNVNQHETHLRSSIIDQPKIIPKTQVFQNNPYTKQQISRRKTVINNFPIQQQNNLRGSNTSIMQSSGLHYSGNFGKPIASQQILATNPVNNMESQYIYMPHQVNSQGFDSYRHSFRGLNRTDNLMQMVFKQTSDVNNQNFQQIRIQKMQLGMNRY